MHRDSLFDKAFDVIDDTHQRDFAELTGPCARMGSGAEPTLDGRKGDPGHPALAV